MDVRIGLWGKLSKNWCFWTMVLKKTLESPWNPKEIQPVHSKGDQSWVFIERTDAEAENPILWLPHVKSWLIGKDPDAGRDWGQKEKRTTEDEMAGDITDSMGMSLSKLWELVMDSKAWSAVIHEVIKSQIWLSDWTELTWSSQWYWGIQISRYMIRAKVLKPVVHLRTLKPRHINGQARIQAQIWFQSPFLSTLSFSPQRAQGSENENKQNDHSRQNNSEPTTRVG